MVGYVLEYRGFYREGTKRGGRQYVCYALVCTLSLPAGERPGAVKCCVPPTTHGPYSALLRPSAGRPVGMICWWPETSIQACQSLKEIFTLSILHWPSSLLHWKFISSCGSKRTRSWMRHRPTIICRN